MTKIVMRNAALITLLLATSPAHAGPCARAIASVQTQVDTAIENQRRFGWLEAGKPQRAAQLSADTPLAGSLRGRRWRAVRVCP